MSYSTKCHLDEMSFRRNGFRRNVMDPHRRLCFNPYLSNVHPDPYHLDESTFIVRDIRINYLFLFHFTMNMKIMKSNRIASDGTPRLAASHMGLFCFPMSHQKNVRLI